ncbi:MAG: (d)CMP kinase [Clostridia bacterium]|nr:(d)CMP kinase [Clostridia bacterium]
MISVAIDGPAGAGKSTIAKTVSKELGFIYVDTGALYRAIGLKFMNVGFDEELNCDIAKVLEETKVDIKFINGEQRVFLNGEDVSDLIRTPKASLMASAVSAKPQVREFLLDMQRRLARENDVIMDGRDIGTVVLPDATVKIFLTASAKERANRRYKELIEKGMEVNYEDVLSDIEKRDYNDSHRAIAPLKPAEDSVLADTSDCTLEQSVELILSIIKERLDNK